MNERKDRATRRAKDAHVEDLANKVVNEKEALDLSTLNMQFQMLQDVMPIEANEVLKQITDEAERLDPKDKVDEEEVIIYHWLKKKKK